MFYANLQKLSALNLYTPLAKGGNGSIPLFGAMEN